MSSKNVMQIVNNWVKCKQSSVKWATTNSPNPSAIVASTRPSTMGPFLGPVFTAGAVCFNVSELLFF